MKKSYLQKGFTLIELLVVIAIIGILSSVVLASLNTARSKGGDAAVKSNLNNIRAQAELYYDSNNSSYGTLATSTIAATGVCGAGTGMFSDASVKAILASAVANTGDITKAVCGANNATGVGSGGGWAVAVPLKSDATTAWCVDSTGKTGTTTAVVVGSFTGCK